MSTVAFQSFAVFASAPRCANTFLGLMFMEALSCWVLVDSIALRFCAICNSDCRVIFRSHFETNVERYYEVASS